MFGAGRQGAVIHRGLAGVRRIGEHRHPRTLLSHRRPGDGRTDGIHMSKGEVAFTVAAATGLTCTVVAAVCAWVVITDPTSLVPTLSTGADSFITMAARAVAQVTAALLSLIG